MIMLRFQLSLCALLLVCAGCSQSGVGDIECPPSDPVFTPVNIANPDYVKKRLEQGLNPNAQNDSACNKDWLLTYAVRHGAAETVRVLLGAGANVDARSSGLNKTPLFQAAFGNHLQIVEALLSHGADANAVDMLGNNSLREAATSTSPEMVKMLLKAGCSLNQRNHEGESMKELLERHGTPEIRALVR